MTLPRPAFALTLDGQRALASTWSASQISIELCHGAAHDVARVVAGPSTDLSDLKPGADAQVELGYGDDLTTIFTGSISSILINSTGVEVEILPAAYVLSAAFVGQSYIKQDISSIARDLISQGNAQAGTLEPTTALAIYVADAKRSVWSHLSQLASFSGVMLCSAADGSVDLRPFGSPGPATPLRYGAEVLHYSWGEHVVLAASKGSVYGSGSALGAEKWHILLKDPAPSDGESANAQALVRDQDTLDTWNQTQEDRVQRQGATGLALVLGDPNLRPGVKVTLKDLPDRGDIDSVIVKALHRLDAQVGYVTALSLEAAS